MKPIIDTHGMKYRGTSHFDHSWIDIKYRDQKQPKVVTLLREPVDRIISNFHHAKTLKVYQNSPIMNQTIEQYIQDTDTVRFNLKKSTPDNPSHFFFTFATRTLFS